MPGKGETIIINSEPKGVFKEGIISGTPKPGTVMELVPSTVPVGGRFTWRAVTSRSANGAKGLMAVLLEDKLQGKLITDAYVSGTRGFLYCPIAGEELNMLLDYPGGTGTSDEDDIGELLTFENGTGKLIPAGSYASAPFMLLENLDTAITADTLVWTMYLGNQA